MAYFDCIFSGGSSGGGYTLTVTCSASFAGTTITCTDGTTTLTATCPSASPYEVEFEIPNGGDWTISGVVSGQTVTTGVNIPTTAELIAFIPQSITIHSAKEDTLTYVDVYGDTQTEVFSSDQTSKSITVDILPSGSSITFTSGVAKDPNNLSDSYSKTVTIDSNTTDVYVMPNNALYWFGFVGNDLENCVSANGWSVNTYTMSAPTYNTNDITAGTTTNVLKGVGTKSAINMNKLVLISTGITYVSPAYSVQAIALAKNINNLATYAYTDSTSIKKYEIVQSGTYNAMFYAANGRAGKLHAMWYE